MIASQYGWTYDEFKKVTLRTLQGCLDMIEIRTHNEYVKKAALSGVKLDFKHVKRKFKELSDEQKEMMAKTTREAVQRKLMEKAEKARMKNERHK